MAMPAVSDATFLGHILAARNDHLSPPLELLAGDQAAANFLRHSITHLDEAVVRQTRAIFKAFGSSLADIGERARIAHAINPTITDKAIFYLSSTLRHADTDTKLWLNDQQASIARTTTRLADATVTVLPSFTLSKPKALVKDVKRIAQELRTLLSPSGELLAELTKTQTDANVDFEGPFDLLPLNPHDDFPTHSYSAIPANVAKALKEKKISYSDFLQAFTSSKLEQLERVVAATLNYGITAASCTGTILLLLNQARGHYVARHRLNASNYRTTETGIKTHDPTFLLQQLLVALDQTQVLRAQNALATLDVPAYLIQAQRTFADLERKPASLVNGLARTLGAAVTTNVRHLDALPRVFVPANIPAEDLEFLEHEFKHVFFARVNRHSEHPLLDAIRALFQQHISILCRGNMLMIGGNAAQNAMPGVVHCCAGEPSARQDARFIGRNPLPPDAQHNFQTCGYRERIATAISIFASQTTDIAEFATGMMMKGVREAYVALMLPAALLDPLVNRYVDDQLGVEYRQENGKIYMSHLDHAALGYVDDAEKVMSWMRPPPNVPGHQIFVEEKLSVGSCYLLHVRIGVGAAEETIQSWAPRSKHLVLPYFEPVEETKGQTFCVTLDRFTPLVNFVIGQAADKRTLTNVMNRMRGNLAEVKLGGKTINKRWKIGEREAISVCMHALTCAFIRTQKAEKQARRVWTQNSRADWRTSDHFLKFITQSALDFLSLRRHGETSAHYSPPTLTIFREWLAPDQTIESANIYNESKFLVIRFEPKDQQLPAAAYSNSLLIPLMEAGFSVAGIPIPIARAVAARVPGAVARLVDFVSRFRWTRRQTARIATIHRQLPQWRVRRADVLREESNCSIDGAESEMDVSLIEGEVNQQAGLGEQQVVDEVLQETLTDREPSEGGIESPVMPQFPDDFLPPSIPASIASFEYEYEPHRQRHHTYESDGEQEEYDDFDDEPAAPMRDIPNYAYAMGGESSTARLATGRFYAASDKTDQSEQAPSFDSIHTGTEESSRPPASSYSTTAKNIADRRPGEPWRCWYGRCLSEKTAGNFCEQHQPVVTAAFPHSKPLTLAVDDDVVFTGTIDFGREIVWTDGGSEGNKLFYNAHKDDRDIKSIAKYFEARMGQPLHVPDVGAMRVIDELITGLPVRELDAEASRNAARVISERLMEVRSISDRKHRSISGFLNNNRILGKFRKPSLHISGPAGAAKTTMLKSLLKAYHGRHVLFILPTNELLNTARTSFAKTGARITFGSQHELPFILDNEKLPSETKNVYKMRRYELTIIDEAYTMTQEVVDFFTCLARRSITLGDPQQIGPVTPEFDAGRPSAAPSPEFRCDSPWVEFTVSFTIPQDIMTFLRNAHLYPPTFQTASSVRHSVFLTDHERDVNATVMHFASADTLPPNPYNRLSTINQQQGHRVEDSFFFMTVQNRMMPHFNPRHVLSMITRHSRSITIKQEEDNLALVLLNPRNYVMTTGTMQPLLNADLYVRGIMSRFQLPRVFERSFLPTSNIMRNVLAKSIFSQNATAIDDGEALVGEVRETEESDRVQLEEEYVSCELNMAEVDAFTSSYAKDDNAAIALNRADEFHIPDAPLLTHMTTEFQQFEQPQPACRATEPLGIAFCQSSKNQRESLMCAALRSAKLHKGVSDQIMAEVPEIVEDFLDHFIDREKMIAFNKTGGTVAWIQDRIEKFDKITDVAFAEAAFTTKVEQFLKTQSKAAVKQIHAGLFKPGQDVQASSAQFCALVCPAAREFSANLRDCAKDNVLVDAGYNDIEFAAALDEKGIREKLRVENVQIDITAQSINHTRLHVAILCALFVYFGGDPEIAELYYMYRSFNEIKESHKFFKLFNIWKLNSGDPFTLIANIVHSLLCLLFRFEDLKGKAVITKGDDNTIEKMRMEQRRRWRHIDMALGIDLKIELGLACFHASRYILPDIVYPDFVKATFNLIARTKGVALDEMYSSLVSRGFRFQERHREQLIQAANDQHGLGWAATEFCLVFTAALSDRRNFDKFFFSDRTNHTGLINESFDCVYAVCRALDINVSRESVARLNQEQVVSLFLSYGFRVLKMVGCYDELFITEEIGLVQVFADHVLVRLQ